MKAITYFTLSLLLFFTAAAVNGETFFLLDLEREWVEALEQQNPGNNSVRPPLPEEIDNLIQLWNSPDVEGEPFRTDEFRMPELFVAPDVDPETPGEQAGMVMGWGNPAPVQQGGDEGSDMDLSAGWVMEYSVDPDLTNTTISLKVTAPSFITSVTFGLIDLEGDQISWNWSPGTDFPNGFSPPGAPTTITINTANMPFSMATPTPMASGFAPNPNFDINKVASFFINETFHTTPGIFTVSPPGGGSAMILGWNAWDEFEVKPNPTSVSPYKGYHVKYSQKPEEFEPGLIYGWDQLSYFNYIPGIEGVVFMAADDWVCTDSRPITDLHWWGSFKGWTRNFPPSIVPDYFLIGIWKDVPAFPPQKPYSNPKELVWAHKCYKWVWNYAGEDIDPRCNYPRNDLDPDFFTMIGQYNLQRPHCEEGETCFQFNQLLSEDEYFKQEEGENIYWISIAAVYQNISDPREIPYPWGWKTKPYNPDKAPDIAVIINDIDNWPLIPGMTSVTGWKPIILPNQQALPNMPFDLTFELTTNQPPCTPEIKGDIDGDCDVDLDDLYWLSINWLEP